MRVVHLIEISAPGGAQNMILRMVDGLAKRGIDSAAVLLEKGWLYEQLKARGIPCSINPLERSLDLTWLRGTTRFIEQVNGSVLHAHEFAMNSYAAMIAKQQGIRCVATVHGKNYYSERLRRRLAYRFVSRAAQMVAVSEDIRQFLVSEVGVQAGRIAVIHNGIDLNAFAPDRIVRERTRQELGIGKGELLVGAVGMLLPVKGHDVMVRAASKILRQVPNVRFVIAGEGQERGALERLIESFGIQEQVHLVGFREDIPALLSAMDLFILPSRSEGHPFAVLEAMAAGVPVVAARVGGVPEIISEHRNGTLFEAEDSDGLALIACELLSRETVANAMADRARHDVAGCYGVDAMVERYLDLYCGQTSAAPLAIID